MNQIKKYQPTPKSRRWDYYLPKDKTAYTFDLLGLRHDYKRFSIMGKKEFTENLLHIMHFCCIVGYYKDLKRIDLLSDSGIIHEIVHLLTINPKDNKISKKEWNESYNNVRDNFHKFEI